MSGNDEEPDVGSLAEEAAKLLGALTDWAKDTAQDVDEHLATGSAECTWCPICRTVHTVRQLSPEVRAQLATAASSLLQAASGLLAAAAAPDTGSRPGVEHIDLDGEDWHDEHDEQEEWAEEPAPDTDPEESPR